MIVHARVAPKRDTTKRWEQKPDFIPFRGEIIIYTDKYHDYDEEGHKINIPAMKIGDGRTRIADLPFMGGGSTPVRYDQLIGLPKINGVELSGEISLDELGIQPAGEYPEVPLSPADIDAIIDEADSEE